MACIFIGQLPFSKFFDADLYQLLEPYGRVLSVRMHHKKGEAFVTFASVNGADAAIAALHGQRTLARRNRPLQLFYATSSPAWSWYGIVHNTCLHHLNPKVELPPFFSRKPPLEEAQWTLVPHPTREATELVLPSTLAAMRAAAAAQREATQNEQKTSSSSLRTTTSSSPLFSQPSNSGGSSGATSVSTTSTLPSSSTSTPSTGPQPHGELPSSAGVAVAGTKRTRLPTAAAAGGTEAKCTAAAVKARKVSPVVVRDASRSLTTSSTAPPEAAVGSGGEVGAVGAGQTKRKGKGSSGSETAEAEEDEEERQRAERRRAAHRHRKTKLIIEDADSPVTAATGGVRGAERDEEEEKKEGVRGPSLPLAPAAASASATAAPALSGWQAEMLRSGDEHCSFLQSSSGGGLSSIQPPPLPTGTDGGLASSSAFADSLSLPMMSSVAAAANASPLDMPVILEHSTTTPLHRSSATPSAGRSLAEGDDAVGPRGVVIVRRRRPNTVAGVTRSPAEAASVGLPVPQQQRLVRVPVLPRHFHHASHTSPSLAGSSSSTTTTTGTANAAASHSSSGVGGGGGSVSAASGVLVAAEDSQQTVRRVASPHHHHHHHHHQFHRQHRQTEAVLQGGGASEGSVLGQGEPSTTSLPEWSWPAGASSAAVPVLATPAEREASFVASEAGQGTAPVETRSRSLADAAAHNLPTPTEGAYGVLGTPQGYVQRRGGRGYRRQ